MAHTTARKDPDKFAAIVTLDQRERFGKTKASLDERRLSLDEQKFQFNATREALAKLDSLKAIKSNSKLTEEQKLEQARLELFGVTPS
jgi:hypothetical protein